MYWYRRGLYSLLPLVLLALVLPILALILTAPILCVAALAMAALTSPVAAMMTPVATIATIVAIVSTALMTAATYWRLRLHPSRWLSWLDWLDWLRARGNGGGDRVGGGGVWRRATSVAALRERRILLVRHCFKR